jgi:hypothetical protein
MDKNIQKIIHPPQSSEETDYTISPKSKFFPDRISTPDPSKPFLNDLISPTTPIE